MLAGVLLAASGRFLAPRARCHFAAELTAIPLGFLLMIQSLVCVGLLVPALDATTSGPATFLQNMARLGVLMAVVDFTSLGLFVSMRALSCFGSPFPALGLTWLGFVFVLLVVSLASLEVSDACASPFLIRLSATSCSCCSSRCPFAFEEF